jgi:molecular chaperone GrpE
MKNDADVTKKIDIEDDGVEENKETTLKNDTKEKNGQSMNVKPDGDASKNISDVAESEIDSTDDTETIEGLKSEIESKNQENQQLYDRFLRLSAEFDNYKKRMIREMGDFKKYSNENILKDLLPVVDNLERAIQVSPQTEDALNSLIEGVDMTLKDTLKVFEKYKVMPIEAQEKMFDPNYHQAMMREETSEYPENTVINEFQKGYMIHDRLLRPAMVVVAVAPKQQEKEEGDSTDE